MVWAHKVPPDPSPMNNWHLLPYLLSGNYLIDVWVASSVDTRPPGSCLYSWVDWSNASKVSCSRKHQQRLSDHIGNWTCDLLITSLTTLLSCLTQTQTKTHRHRHKTMQHTSLSGFSNNILEANTTCGAWFLTCYKNSTEQCIQNCWSYPQPQNHTTHYLGHKEQTQQQYKHTLLTVRVIASSCLLSLITPDLAMAAAVVVMLVACFLKSDTHSE